MRGRERGRGETRFLRMVGIGRRARAWEAKTRVTTRVRDYSLRERGESLGDGSKRVLVGVVSTFVFLDANVYSVEEPFGFASSASVVCTTRGTPNTFFSYVTSMYSTPSFVRAFTRRSVAAARPLDFAFSASTNRFPTSSAVPISPSARGPPSDAVCDDN